MGVPEGGKDAFALEMVRVRDGVDGIACSEMTQHRGCVNSSSLDYRLAKTNPTVRSDAGGNFPKIVVSG